MKKALLVLVVLLALGAVGGYLALRSGFGGADDWVVRRVVRIAETYIEPKIAFTDFAWDGSRTITLEGVTLTSDDGTEVVNAGSMIIVTERVPINGGAFIIEAITLEDATLRLVQTTASDGSIGFKGLVPFVKATNIENQDEVPEEVKLSEVFKIRTINLDNGGFEYDAGDGSQPMVLKGITLDVNLTPEDNGAYALDVDLTRDKVFEIVVKGDLNLDTMALNAMDLRFDADLSSDEAVAAIPPQIQTLLRQYEVRGQMASTITGDLLLSDPIASTMTAKVTLSDGHFAAGEYDFPVSGMNLEATVAGKEAIAEMDMSTSGGLVSIPELRVDLSADGMPTTLSLDIGGVDIQEFLRYQPPENKPPKFAGILSLKLTEPMRFNLADLGEAMEGTLAEDRISGKGTLTLRNGRLVSIPIISDVIDAMDVVAALTGTQTLKDTADLEFTMDGKGLRFPDKGIQVSTQLASLRGDGRINYDQSLRLSLNGGPVEKLQDQLGGIGDILGAVTDGIVKYVVKGRFGDIEVGVKPLGIGG
ncbi:MAG: hypothetical protein Tsb0013_12850 [Phycisphaerales bacterium]